MIFISFLKDQDLLSYILEIILNLREVLIKGFFNDEKLLFKKGDWEVALLRYDDRSTACIARNGLGNKEFQIYVNADVDEFAIFYDNSNVNKNLKKL